MVIEIRLRTSFDKGEVTLMPDSDGISNWAFKQSEEKEAVLAYIMHELGKENGMNANDLHKLFPAVLRMLKNNSSWVQNS